MKKQVITAIALATLAGGSAIAADLPTKAPPVVTRPACAQFGGFYIGANAGGAYYEHTWDQLDNWAGNADVSLGGSVRSTKGGFVGGGQAGYNWQSGCTVFGVQVDYDWASVKNDVFKTDGGLGLALDTLSVTSRLRGIGTARTRAGVIVDNLLIYVTGGFAFADFKRSATLTDNFGGVFVSETLSSNKMKYGWTVGVGTEWALWGNWSLQSEVLYAGFQRDQKTFNTILESNPVVLPKRFSYDDNVWMSRIGLNYRFGAPVVARY